MNRGNLSDPRLRHRKVFWIDCTVCGPDAHPPPPWFATEAELWRSLLSVHEYGWTRRDDGRIPCRAHSDVATCEAEGHVVAPWAEHPLDDELDWRYCTRCGARFQQRIMTTPRAQPPEIDAG